MWISRLKCVRNLTINGLPVSVSYLHFRVFFIYIFAVRCLKLLSLVMKLTCKIILLKIKSEVTSSVSAFNFVYFIYRWLKLRHSWILNCNMFAVCDIYIEQTRKFAGFSPFIDVTSDAMCRINGLFRLLIEFSNFDSHNCSFYTSFHRNLIL